MWTSGKGTAVKVARRFQNSVVGAALAVAISAGGAHASPIGSWVDYQFSSYTGNTNTVNAKITQTSANTLTFSLNQVGNTGSLSTTVGEFRAFYFSVADASLLSGVTIAGVPDVTDSVLNAGLVTQIPGASNSDTQLNGSCGVANNCVFDVGVGFGTNGQDNPLILSTSFTYTRTAGLDLSAFFATSGDIMGARMKPFGDGRSSKDACNATHAGCLVTTSSSSSSSSSGGPGPQGVPEPGMLGIFGAALLGLGLMRRRKAN